MTITPADAVSITPDPLGIMDVVRVARHDVAVTISEEAIERVVNAHEAVKVLESAEAPVYGISTGFGAMASRHIPPSDRRRLQVSLIRSHAAGVGDPVEREVVRAMMLLRARTLATGYSGVRPVVLERLVDLLNHGLTPLVPEHGSLGCSGDLAPLAHVALALIGEGVVETTGGGGVPAELALAEVGLEPIRLEPKEGLSLINGTDGMLGMLVLATTDIGALLDCADLTAAMSIEALLGTDQTFDPALIALRPQVGQQVSAHNLRRFLAGSEIVASHRDGDSRVQDAYSLRCTPQVHGATRDTLDHARRVVELELAAAIDNPVVIEGAVRSHGNFHGAPLALVADFLCIALADAAAIAERRIDRQLDVARSHGLPAFLAEEPGVDSGLMLGQYTAAALVAECRRLAQPAAVDSIPTSAMQEDHVSMGWAACRKLRKTVDAFGAVLGIEAVVAARGLDCRRPLRPARRTAAARAVLRELVPGMGPDRYLAPELALAIDLVRNGTLLRAAGEVRGD